MSGFREDDIRPERFGELMEKARDEDIKRLAARRAGFVHAPCPACGNEAGRFAFEKFSFSFSRCPKCETIYMTPRATSETLDEFYSGSRLYAFWNAHVFPASAETRRERIFRPRVERLLALMDRRGATGGSLLEVGAGFGLFCEEAAKTGRFSGITAVEPTPDLAGTLGDKGIKVVNSPFETADLEGPFGVIAAFEVVEHLFSPRDFLIRCRELMNRDSLLVLTCPNGKGFDIDALGPASDSVDAEHVNLFNPESLEGLLEACGFSVLEVSTPGVLDAELVRKKALDGAVSLDGQPFLRTVLIDRYEELGGPFQTFLRQNKLSSHMWVAAKPAG